MYTFKNFTLAFALRLTCDFHFWRSNFPDFLIDLLTAATSPNVFVILIHMDFSCVVSQSMCNNLICLVYEFNCRGRQNSLVSFRSRFHRCNRKGFFCHLRSEWQNLWVGRVALIGQFKQSKCNMQVRYFLHFKRSQMVPQGNLPSAYLCNNYGTYLSMDIIPPSIDVFPGGFQWNAPAYHHASRNTNFQLFLGASRYRPANQEIIFNAFTWFSKKKVLSNGEYRY